MCLLFEDINMKVKDLIKKLSDLDPEADVSIPVTLTHVTIGARPSVNIVHVGKGIDWDSSTVHLHPERQLVALTEEQFEYFHSELRKADKQRQEYWRSGIKDPKIVEKDINPLFKRTGE